MFGYLSSLTSVDIYKEVPLSKGKKVCSVMKLHYLVLTLTYFIFGFAGYYRYGNDLSYYDSGVILMNPDFASSPSLFCNLLVVFYTLINEILNFKPQKNILTYVFRTRERDSAIWHYTSILMIHLVQTGLACLVVGSQMKIHQVVFFAFGLYTPFVKFVFPLIVFNKCFYLEDKYLARRRFYYGLMFLGIFINCLTVGNLFLRDVGRN